jgi:tetratricopeptide (TPR) repeat protein
MAVRPDFVLSPANAVAVGEIVRRLDGLPLAIELAAARIRLLSPAAMAQRLHDRLGLLSSGGRDLPERQRTLRGAIDWSHDLLEAEDRVVFARLGVFAGGAEVEMAERVCGSSADEPGPAEPGADVVGGIERLAEQSLVRVVDDPHGDVRVQMLETIREYALERLAASDEAEAVRERHARSFLELVRGGGSPTARTDEARGGWLDRLEDDHDNIRAALEWFMARGDADCAADLVHGVWRFWQQRGHLVEGRRRIDQVLAMAGASPGSTARLRALEAAGGLAYWTADMRSAASHYAAAVEEARATGDEAEIANALYNQSFAQNPEGSPATWVADLLAADQPMLEEALEIWTRLGDDSGRARALWAIGEHHIYRGELEEGEAAVSEALSIFERLGDAFWVAWSHFTRAYGRVRLGHVQAAARDLHDALAGFLKADDVSGVVLVQAGLAGLLLETGRTEDAYRVAAATERRMSQTGIYLATLSSSELFEMPDLQTADPALRRALDEGAAWSADEARDRAAALLADVVARGSVRT